MGYSHIRITVLIGLLTCFCIFFTSSGRNIELEAAETCTAPANVAPDGVATQSSNWNGSQFPASLAVDGNHENFTHTARGQANASWQLELGDDHIIDEVVLHNRGNCCGSRLRDITVSVLDQSGNSVYQSALLNPENALNTPEQITVSLPQGVVGRTVHVQRTSDPDLSGSNGTGNADEPDILSLAEVEIFACEAPQTTNIVWSNPINTTSKSQLLEGDVVLALNGGDDLTVRNSGANGNQDYTFVGTTYTQLPFSPNTTSSIFRGSGSSTTGDGNFDTLINSFTYATSGVTSGIQTIDGLTSGQTYSVQIFYNDQRSNRSMTFGNAADASQRVQIGAKGIGWGQHAVGTFIAADSTIQLEHITNGFNNVHFTAILIVEGAPSPTNPSTVTVDLYGDLTTDDQLIEVFLTFSEAVNNITEADLTVDNGVVHSVSGEGRYYTAIIKAITPGDVEVRTSSNFGSGVFTAESNFHTGETWAVDDQSAWQASNRQSTNIAIQEGLVRTENSGTFRSVTRSFATPQKAESITFSQTPTWDNWIGVSNVGPSDARDAPVLLSLGNNDYYLLGLGSSGGYHAWHSTDMVNWVERGPVTPPGDGRWVTSAEYKDGKAYIYSDAPNDMTPHLFIDDDLDDGVVGVAMGAALAKEPCGSDASFFRNDTDQLFHVIYEDWSPINARNHSWDSPLAGHASSVDGLTGFEHHEHQPPVDHRTTPTGVTKTYSHPERTCSYEEHLPEQDAYGDWTTIKVGGQYYMFADYDPHDAGLKVARFTSDSIYKPFDLVGSLGNGHPDPTVGFAEGQFYLITQQSTDYVSSGPWVDGVEARVGVDVDGNQTIDQWTTWQSIEEQYDHKAGYARIVETTPAQVALSELPAGYGFQFQFRLDNNVVANASPVIDSITMQFTNP